MKAKRKYTEPPSEVGKALDDARQIDDFLPNPENLVEKTKEELKDLGVNPEAR